MDAQAHPLEPFFHQAVRNSYEGKLGLNDPDVTGYVARLLCEFSQADKLYKVRDSVGHPIEELEAMLLAADPVNGTATSFDAERALRKYIGDYALFVSGMYPEAMAPGRGRRGAHPSLGELIRAGKESYFIVSQFNLFEYEQEAPLFGRLADSFERCILGLALVREDLNKRKALPPMVN
jgi:hypothetical protein